jgi:hypothetical protein
MKSIEQVASDFAGVGEEMLRENTPLSYGDVAQLERILEEVQRVFAAAKQRPRDAAGSWPRGTRDHLNPNSLRSYATPESREFWEACDEAAREVATWPEWKKAW